MTQIRDVTHHDIFRHPEHCVNQIATRLFSTGEIIAVFNGPHPETGEALSVVDQAPEGFPPVDLPPQPAVFAPDYAPEEVSAIAQKLREAAGLPDEPLGEVANPGNGSIVGKVADKLTP